jgi:hypothetical protein
MFPRRQEHIISININNTGHGQVVNGCESRLQSGAIVLDFTPHLEQNAVVHVLVEGREKRKEWCR